MAIPLAIYMYFITKENKSVELARVKKERLLRFGLKESREVDRMIEVLEYDEIFRRVMILGIIPLTPGIAKGLAMYFTTAAGYMVNVIKPHAH